MSTVSTITLAECGWSLWPSTDDSLRRTTYQRRRRRRLDTLRNYLGTPVRQDNYDNRPEMPQEITTTITTITTIEASNVTTTNATSIQHLPLIITLVPSQTAPHHPQILSYASKSCLLFRSFFNKPGTKTHACVPPKLKRSDRSKKHLRTKK